MTEVIETRGDYRAVLHPQEDATMPDGDFFGYMFTLDGNRAELLAKAYGTPDEDTFNLGEAWERFRDMELVERYLRMFYDVVGVDYLERRDHKIVNVVTRKDLELWGWNPDDPELWPKNEDGTTRKPTDGNLDEWEAWADGDVWYWTVEKRVHWTTEDPDVADRDTWEEVDSVGGYYGDEYARESALEALDTYQAKAGE